jgi:hypothetical protein
MAREDEIDAEPPVELVIPSIDGEDDSDGRLYCGAVGVAKYVMPDGVVKYREFWSRDILHPEALGLTISLGDTLREILMGSRER